MGEVDTAKLQAGVFEKSQRLFADGYRGVAMTDTDSEKPGFSQVAITNPRGETYYVDLLEDTCDCAFFQHWGGQYKCKHLLGWSKLLADQGNVNGAPKFPLGTTVSTPGALEALIRNTINPAHFLVRHSLGDWGELDAEDRQANERALLDGARLLSAYRLPDETKIWLITEWDRSATTILLPEEY